MKKKLIIFGVSVALALADQSLYALGVLVTPGIRIDDWNYSGCNNSPGAAGAPASGDSGAGGNQASCATCPDDGGMARWSVDEPNINLHVSDTPLEYITSSGQKVSFRLFYKQRFLVPPTDRCKNCETVYGSDAVNMHSMGLTNASWNHNWLADIKFWDSGWWDYYNSHGFTSPPYAEFSGGYEAMVFYPQGDVQYFYEGMYDQGWMGDPQRQSNLLPLSGMGYATVTSSPTADANGIYWGAPASDNNGNVTTNGLRITYPDGSQDVFALAYRTTESGHAFLTQRIDPAGRVTQLGYEQVLFYNSWNVTNYYYAYRLKFVVDSDGRTNTFYYNDASLAHTPWELQEIDDPYGRKATFAEDDTIYGGGRLTNITDAASNSTTFSYVAFDSTNYWLNGLTTPYGTTAFYFGEVKGPTNIPFSYAMRAAFVSEPEGAGQLFLFTYQETNGVPTTLTAPSVPDTIDFDDGSSLTAGTSFYELTYRNSFYWGRRQCASLPSGLVTSLGGGGISGAISNLTASAVMLGRLSHWLLVPKSDAYVTEDGDSLSEFVSLTRDPSPDGGVSPGGWTWFNYAHKYNGSEVTGDSQINCIARILQSGQVAYTRYNYYSGDAPVNGLVSDNETSVTLPDGTEGEVINWFNYATNDIDVTNISNSLGQYVNLGYNASHQVIAITDAANQTATFVYDATTHNLKTNSLPSGQTIYYSYYAATNPATSTNALLKQIDVEPEGRLINFADYTFNLPRVVSISGPNIPGFSVTNFWDSLNRPTGSQFQDGTTASNIFTILHRTAHHDRMTNWTYYGYDGLEHLTSLTNARGAVLTMGWCGCGELTSVTDAYTNTISLSYDNQSRPTGISYPDGSSFTWQYDLDGRVTNAFDGAGVSVQMAYDTQGLVTNLSNVYGALEQAVFDLAGRPIQITDANGVTVTNAYDAVNRLISRTWPDGTGETFGYGTNGLIASTNRNGQVTLFGRDGAGRVTSVTNANLAVTQFRLDALDHLTNLIDGLNHTNAWNYNPYGWATNKVDASNHQAFVYSFDANGRVTNRWMPGSGNTAYAYDAVGNLTNVVYSNTAPASISYFYDALNRVTNMIDATGTNSFTYTQTGQLLSETGPWPSNKLTYGYTQGHRTSMALSQPSGGAWTNAYTYDNEWRLTGLTAPSGSYAYGYAASASALVQSLALPNAAYITYQYDSLARLTNTSLANYWRHVLDGYGYAYDALGQRTNLSRNLGLTTNNVTIGYDSIGQLISWSAAETNGALRLNEQLDYVFDAAGNLIARTNGSLAQTFSVDALNQLANVSRTGALTLSGATPAPATNVTVNGQNAQIYADLTFARTNITLVNGNNTFTNIATNAYGLAVTNIVTANLPANVVLQSDLNGNLTSDGTRFMVYNAENQLTNVYVTNLWKTEFVYDGLGRRRIERDYTWTGGAWSKTNETRYIFDGMLPIQERDSNNVVKVTYTRGLDLSLSLQGAGGIGGLLARTDTNGSTFYHADGSGNITAMMDGNQNMVARYEYGPFGQMLGMWGVMGPVNQIRFSSFYTGPSGIVLSPTRPYFPELQRWGSRDPIGEAGGLNLYGFAGNNPVNFADPYGLSFWNYLGFSGGPADANAAMEAMVQAHDYANMKDFLLKNPSYHGWTPLDAVAPAADAWAASADLYINGAQAIVPAGIAAKGTEAAAQGIADAAEEGWLSKVWNKCFGKKTPRNSSLAGTTHPVTGIPFNAHGFPDFSSVAKETVKIVYTGTREGDYEAANLAAGLEETPEGYTWHHVEDGTTMQLVPTDIHTATGHTGGFSMYPKK